MKHKFKASSLAVFLFDCMIINFSLILSMLLRFEFRWSNIPTGYIDMLKICMPIFTVVMVAVYAVMHLYQFIWRFISIKESGRIMIAVCIGWAINIAVSLAINCRLPISVYAMAFSFIMLLTLCLRFSFRLFLSFESIHQRLGLDEPPINTMVIGAGSAGQMVIREFQTSDKLNHKVLCVIDDNINIANKYIGGVPVVGTRKDIVDSVNKYDIKEIVLAIPSAPNTVKKEILDICKEVNCKLQILPGIYQLVNGDVNVSQLRDVNIEDLLAREQINVNVDEIAGYVTGKIVMVTGGGGSIGSELCRQIAAKNPKQLIIVDIYENNAYEIQQELKRDYPELNLLVLIASVRNTERIDSLFKTYRPDLVYHAAAHKHVPLMEDSPNEAIKNNVFGTYNTAKCAIKYGAKKFVLISTDKAVNPTNIMGASKRLCEMIVQALNKVTDKTDFVAVRFGNVLGSNGSVIPLFREQIAKGGPVTVTHPDIIRFFMTIPEAVSLVLQAGAYAKGGEIFILDMGEPVKIADLARNLISLSGYKPDIDIKIEYTGLRPGEKLYEEILMKEEGLTKTGNKMIYIGQPIEIDNEVFFKQLDNLYDECYSESPIIKEAVAAMVPTYQPEGE